VTGEIGNGTGRGEPHLGRYEQFSDLPHPSTDKHILAVGFPKLMRALVRAAVVATLVVTGILALAPTFGALTPLQAPSAPAGAYSGNAPNSAPSSPVFFTETGLPSGTNWSVTINGTADGAVGSIAVGTDPRGILYDPLNGQIYLAISGENNVSVIDPTHNTVVGSIPVGSDPRYIALDPTNGYLYVTNTLSDNVTVINGANDTVVGSIPVGINPIGITFDPTNGYLYVADSAVYDYNVSSADVSVINTATDTVAGTISVGTDARALVYDPLNTLVYVANYGSGNLTIINTTLGAVTGSVFLGIGVAPSAPAIDTTTGELYVSDNNWAGHLFVLDPANDSVLTVLTVGAYPAGPVYDPLNGYVYVGNEFSGNVSIIATNNNTVVSQIPTDDYPATIGVDRASGTVYVVNWQSDLVMAVDGSAVNGGGEILGAPVTMTNTTSVLGGTILYTSGPGLFDYSIGVVPGYSATPTTGSVVLNLSGASIWVDFEPSPLGNVTFEETHGLPSGASWSVTLGGQTVTSRSTTIRLTAPAGVYTYLVTGPSGRQVSGLPAVGIAELNGSGAVAKLQFQSGHTYHIALTEHGLPHGATWCVTVGAMACTSRATLTLNGLAPGTYSYSIANRAGDDISATLGGSGISLFGTFAVTDRSLAVSVKFVHPYPVTFTETGLPSGSAWSIKVAGAIDSSTTSTIAIGLANGTHGYSIGAIVGYTHSGVPNPVHVHGAGVSVNIVFRERPGSAAPSPGAAANFAPVRGRR